MTGPGSRTIPHNQNDEQGPLQPDEDDLDSDSENPMIVPPMSALEILREAIRILRSEISAFTSILLLICPFSAALLAGAFVSDSLTSAFSRRLILAAGFAGLPPTRILRQVCHHVAGTTLSVVSCLPLLLSLLLAARALTAHAVACCYRGKSLSAGESFETLRRIWRRLLITYFWIGGVVFFYLAISFAVGTLICNLFLLFGLSSTDLIYPLLAILTGGYAYTVVVCNLSGVVSVLEDSWGIEALLHSVRLLRERIQAGLTIFLGSTVGLVFVHGLFEHRVKYLSYGDGSSRIWEGPLLVLMHSFVILLDSMMNAILYFTCVSGELSPGSCDREMEAVDFR